jgi:alkylation response protein AidB-like acyl-CoA dehydrogenase
VDVRYPPQAEQFREKVRVFLAEHLPGDWAGIGTLEQNEVERFIAEWRTLLYKHGFLGIAWPVEYGGGGLTKVEQVVLAEEMAWAGVPAGSPNDLFSIKMLGNLLLKWGTEEQKRHFLPRILSGEISWCQGFSEPDAGSDLAGLRTRARLDGGQWRIDGQKIWTSEVATANWIFLLVRTQPEAPKHQGLSFLLCPIDQPGIEVRPIKMLSGQSTFNEVFFTDARTDAANIVGEDGEGWAVAATLLSHERGEDAAIHPILFRIELDRLLRLAHERGRADDPLVQDRLAQCYIRVEIMRFLGYRILTSDLQSEGRLGPEVSIAKLYWSEYHQEVTALALDILGADAMVPTGRGPSRAVRADDPGAPSSSASWVGAFYNSLGDTIYAGSSEIQRKILAESVLGLPRDGTRSPART